MKNISKIIIMLLVASMALLVGCGGGGGGGSDTPTGQILVSGDVTVGTSNMTFYFTCPSTFTDLAVTNPSGYTVSYVSGSKYKVVGPVISNPTTSTVYKSFTFSYMYNGNEKTQNVSVPIPPSGSGDFDVTVTKPTDTYEDAYKLQYSSSNHIISVKVVLPDSYKSKTLNYVWHKDSENGTIITGSDSVYDSAEFVYRPNDTSVIPADVTTGTTRKYNRGFKINSDLEDTYIYLVIKTSDGTKVGVEKFYVDEPATPPTPTSSN